ncbi:MAG: uracil phosphoribosyltransferase [Bacteroidales bacterium]|nr:uracil phosphoribosyltransferase [Bacteroidales bacterium]
MKIYNLGGKGTLIDQFISEIRDHEIQLDRARFRNNLARTGEIMAYEISKMLPFTDEDITTSLGIANVPTMAEQPVLATVLRAGLPFHQGFVNYFDHADSAFIAGYRKYDKSGGFEIKIDYVTSPQIEDKILIINDPMLASGGSIELAYKALLNYGNPKHVHIASIIASKEGIDYIERVLPESKITLWLGAIDDELTVKSYIVPGLGDAGDLAYGYKTDN